MVMVGDHDAQSRLDQARSKSETESQLTLLASRPRHHGVLARFNTLTPRAPSESTTPAIIKLASLHFLDNPKPILESFRPYFILVSA